MDLVSIKWSRLVLSWSQMLAEYIALFKEFKDVIAWSYKDMKGILPELCQHRIYLEDYKTNVPKAISLKSQVFTESEKGD